MSLLHLPDDSTHPKELDALHQLQQWHIDSKIEIFVSEKSRTEARLNQKRARALDPGNLTRFNKWLETLNILDDYGSVSGRWILGVSTLGVDTILAADSENETYDGIANLLFGSDSSKMKEGDIFDLGILFEHYIQGSDIFVTRDNENKILRKRAELKKNWNIVVCNPMDAVLSLRQVIDRK